MTAAGAALGYLDVNRRDVYRLPFLVGTNLRSVGQIYSPTSPLNKRIDADARMDPKSRSFVRGLITASRHRGFVIAVKRYTVPIYVADRHSERRNVSLVADWGPVDRMQNVPIPEAATPDPSSDAHLAILDTAEHCEYDFYRARRTGEEWVADWANVLSLDGPGIFRRGLSARGSGFGLAAGLIWPHELARGRIDHALIFSYPLTSVRGAVAPATETDGQSSLSNAMVVGSRIQLDPALDLDELSLKPYERTIARALQEYGAFLADTGGRGVALYAVHPQSYERNPYRGLLPGTAYVRVDNTLIRHMRVLELDKVTSKTKLSSRARLTQDGC